MRVEVLPGVERRRRWSAEEKLRIVHASLQAGAVVTNVARRNQVSKSLLYEWRRLARMGRLESTAAFMPVQIEQPASTEGARPRPARRRFVRFPRRQRQPDQNSLEHGRFQWPSPADGTLAISAAQLAYTLDGIDWRNPRHTFRPERAG
jgi:transposase-like protein